jgi:hypothetical protein
MLRGRAMSVYTTVFAGSTPIGGLLFGWIASVAGVAIAVAAGGLGAFLVGLGALLWVRSQHGFEPVPARVAARTEGRPSAPVGAPVVESGVAVEALAGPGARPR